MISDLRAELVEMESRVSEANGRHRKTEEQLEELRQEMKDVESLLQTNQDEMMALHEQLTEVCGGEVERRGERERERKIDAIECTCTLPIYCVYRAIQVEITSVQRC